MRHSKTIPLDENRAISVHELRVKDVRTLLAGFNDISKVDVTQVIGERFAEISGLVEPLLTFPAGESLDDLTGSELEAVIEAFKEVNQPFLTLAGLGPAMAILSSGSTSPVASSSNADMATSSTTAGNSSLSPSATQIDETVQQLDAANGGDGKQDT